MSHAKRGVLVVCKGSMAEYIKHIDKKRQEEAGTGFAGSFIIQNLDDHHLWIKEDVVDLIKEKVEQLQAENTYTREVGDEQQQGAKGAKPKKARKGVGGGVDAKTKKKRPNE